MEAERFDLLPEPAFVRSFLRTYARHLGVDEDLVLDEYGYRLEPRELTREHEVVAPLPPPGPMGSLRSRLVAPRGPSLGRQVALLGLGGAGAVAVLLWAGGVGSDRATPPVPTVPAAPAVAARRAIVPAAPIPDVPPGVRVRLVGVGAGSWVQVRRRSAAGPVLFEGILAAGDSRLFRDRRRLAVRVGWAPSLEIRVNGRRVRLEGGTVDVLATRRGAAARPVAGA